MKASLHALVSPVAAARTAVRRRNTIRSALALACSIGAHVGAWVLYVTVFTLPSADIPFQLPDDLELGVVETQQAARPVAPPPPDEGTPTPTPGAGPLDGGVVIADAAVDARRRRRDASSGAEGGVNEAAVATDSDGDAEIAAAINSDAGALEALAPAGAQIAMRLDVARMRSSRHAEGVRALIAAIPDWEALLGGSGIDPLDALDRLLVTSPNLRRDRMVFAGEVPGGADVVRGAVARMAAESGTEAVWQSQDGIDVAPWPNRDETERVVALVGPRAFTIARPVDLPRILAIARARAAELGAPESDTARALVTLLDGEVVSIDVEGARRFVDQRWMHAQGYNLGDFPTRVHVSVRDQPDGSADLEVMLSFNLVDESSKSRETLDALRREFADNAMVRLMGYADLLDATTVEQIDSNVHVRLHIAEDKVARLLETARVWVVAWVEEQTRLARERAGVPGDPTPPSPGPAGSPPPSSAPIAPTAP